MKQFFKDLAITAIVVFGIFGVTHCTLIDYDAPTTPRHLQTISEYDV